MFPQHAVPAARTSRRARVIIQANHDTRVCGNHSRIGVGWWRGKSASASRKRAAQRWLDAPACDAKESRKGRLKCRTSPPVAISNKRKTQSFDLTQRKINYSATAGKTTQTARACARGWGGGEITASVSRGLTEKPTRGCGSWHFAKYSTLVVPSRLCPVLRSTLPFPSAFRKWNLYDVWPLPHLL